jgi:hypothetical protein
MATDHDSGDYIRPLPQYLDNLMVSHPELGTCEFWKVLAWETSKLRNAVARADSAGAIAAEAQKGAPSGQPRHAPPLAADTKSASVNSRKTQRGPKSQSKHFCWRSRSLKKPLGR